MAIYLVTEPVAPYAFTLSSLGLEGAQREQYLSMGMHQVVSAVSFLNNDCKLIHGNVCSASVVVTDSLDWKLHAFDLTTEHQGHAALSSSAPLASASWAVAAQYKPGEVAKGEWDAVREGPPWAVDAWGLGCFIKEVYSAAPLARTEDLRQTDGIPQALLQHYQRLLASQPARRLNPAKIVESGVLRNKLVETTAFLENLALKETMEKDAFFKKLPSLLPDIPEKVAQRKLLPLLASALEFGGAPPVALGTLLRIGEGMPEEERAKQVIPILTKLFASNDRGIRRGLLENIGSFGPALPAALVEEQIYPNVQSGFADGNPYIRELTLKSMVVLGSKLSQKTLNQSLLKHLAKLQVDEEPAIRANTTVLLGNLASLLSESTCKKVLLNAFTRALKDPFPPARAAGLKAVLATAKFHGPEDAAMRVIPMVGPLCIDPIHEVRISALQCMEHFLGELQTFSKELEKRAAVATANGEAPAAGSSGGGSLLTGFGWAMSSLVTKSDTPAPQQGQQGPAPSLKAFGSGTNMPPPAAPAPPATSSSAGNGGTATSSSGWDDEAPAAHVHVPAPAAPSAAASGGAGWGDGDDEPFEDMLDAMTAEMEARQKLSKMAVSRPAARPATAARRPPSAAGAGRPGVKPAGGVAPRQQGGGMKLGASKLGAKKLDEDDFADW